MNPAASTAGRPVLTVVAAMDEGRVIGREGGLPWRIPSDLRRFRAATLGGTVIMGRLTFASLGRPLAGRTNVVLSRKRSDHGPGVVAATDLEDGLRHVADGSGAFVVGGSSVFREALPMAGFLHLTTVLARVGGDVFFPPFDEDEWKVASEVEAFEPGDEHPTLHRVLERVGPAVGRASRT